MSKVDINRNLSASTTFRGLLLMRYNRVYRLERSGR
jgi:hypothetical protein